MNIDKKIDDIVEAHYMENTTCKEMCKQIKQALLGEIKKMDMSQSSHPNCWEQKYICKILGDK